MIALLLAAAVVAGYLVGRIHLARALSTWAWRQIDHRRVTRASWRWWAAQPVFAYEIAALLATQPRQSYRAWRSWRARGEPPPGLVPERRTTPLDEP